MPLGRLGRGDLAVAGGKGANLGELIRAGFPVPDGFVITTAAYDRVLGESSLAETIDGALRDEQQDGARIRRAFEQAPVPEGVERELLAAYRQLGEGPVAVRSSATAEDLPEAAFAGQQDTFLNVIGTVALLDAVRRCWASLWTDRAIAYRARQGIDDATVKLAVVVQRMVDAEAAGVLFTANPVTGARNGIVIDASPGLGEAVVSGLVAPDHFVLRREWWGRRVTERRIGRREVIIRSRSGGGTEHVEGPAATADAPAVPARALRRVARLGARIERHFGSPQDVEWAWADGKPFILQARPITALPEPAPRPSRLQRYQAAILAELIPARPYPLEASTWGPELMLSALLAPLFQLLGLAVPFDELFLEEDGVIVRFRGTELVRPTPAIMLAPLRLFRLARRYNPAHWQADPLLAETQARARALEARDLQALSWERLLETVREALAIPPLLGGRLRLRYIPRAALAAGGLRLALALMGRTDRFGTLLFAGVETKALETNRALEGLAAHIRADPPLVEAFATLEAGQLWNALEAHRSGRVFLAGLRGFLERYGHREAGGTLLVSQGTWKDRPEVVLGMLKGIARAGASPDTGGHAWETAREELLAHPVLKLPLLRSAFLNVLAEARFIQQLLEDTRFYAMLILPVLGRTLRECGRRLASVGVLDIAEDVFHLKRDDLERVAGAWPPAPQVADELRALVVRRKKRRAALEATPLVDPRLYRQTAVRRGALLSGTPGSPGVAEGPVRVIRDSSEFGKLRPAEVLVAPYTNPAWTPLFERAAAVVADSGGAASHEAIVAREYGIPAVMGTVDGTQQLRDGERVRVDGDEGLVFRVPSAADDAP
ncbi:MAG: phosphoenolpyruvate synthase [Chloroflexi bacterium]|nr:phosphoenolpyruvate synthase [Chloroflexota bacterium]